jgi:predicted O-methyltransferase YrrM
MYATTIRPAVVAELKRVGRLVAQRDDAWALPRVSAEFLHALVLSGAFRRGLEIGTSYGYSGLWLGAALEHNGGVLLTLDNNPAKSAFARDAFRRAGLDGTVAVIEGRAEDLPDAVTGPFDFVFIDADKPLSVRYLEAVWPHLAHRATIVADNVTSHAREMKPYVDYVRNHPQLCSVLVPIGSGLELSVKLDPRHATATLDGADWVI